MILGLSLVRTESIMSRVGVLCKGCVVRTGNDGHGVDVVRTLLLSGRTRGAEKVIPLMTL